MDGSREQPADKSVVKVPYGFNLTFSIINRMKYSNNNTFCHISPNSSCLQHIAQQVYLYHSMEWLSAV